MDDLEKGLVRGIGISIQFLINAHGEVTLAGELFKVSGYSLAEFEKVCDSYDMPFIKKAAEE